MPNTKKSRHPEGMRVIKTARDLQGINKAAHAGFMPLVKKLQPSKKIRTKYSVIQNKQTGEIKILGDYREPMYSSIEKGFETVIDWTFYYPHSFKSPFAAYLIPKDIQIGEKVFIEDLIQDFIEAQWNQGDAYRLQSCEAIWNGSDLEIQHDPNSTDGFIVG